jgi:type I restriction enzyme M protein
VYDHSENLGDAFEYLLSVLGSQGDAGQFRTPRNIIDFMVAVIDPQKNEVIIDPACGTAGFLISSYRHIIKANTKKVPGDLLTTGERKKLLNNFRGYDISPDMVRLSLVNLYLHGFSQPKIYEYDTLTSDERWNEYGDVLFANPPFMSPKGGIKPHKRFSVQSSRSEVLFVDYIAEHLTTSGRAAVIVPEGIIFQSGSAYKQLRKSLVEKYLYAVVSLPAGVFNPYSGVKTSILFFEPLLAQKSDSILFVKIENDGFSLGAQRRAIENNDLPEAAKIIGEFRKQIINPKKEHTVTIPASTVNNLVVSKKKFIANGDYNLSGERYREGERKGKQKWSMVRLGDKELFSIESGGTPDSKNKAYWAGDIHWATLVDLPQNDYITIINDTQRKITQEGLKYSSAKIIPANSIVVSTRATIGRIGINKIPICTNQGFKNVIIKDKTRVNHVFLAFMIKQLVPKMQLLASGGTFKEISKTAFCFLEIPLPPIEVQQEIVTKIENYQKIIDGARQVVDNWKPHIEVDPDWPMVDIASICNVNPKKSEVSNLDEKMEISFVPMSDIGENSMFFDAIESKRLGEVSASYTYFKNNDVLIAKVTPCFENGKAGIARELKNGIGFGSSEFYILRPSDNVLSEWIFMLVASSTFRIWATPKMTGTGGLQRVPRSVIEHYKIPLPPLETQQAIVADIEAERALVAANRELIVRMEKKIQAVIARVWETE